MLWRRLGFGMAAKSKVATEAALSELPHLNAAFQAWKAESSDGLPQRLDPLKLPPQVLQYVLLADLIDDPRDAIIRLAGVFLRDLYGRNPHGGSIREFLGPGDAETLIDLMFHVAQAGKPELCDRVDIEIRGNCWSYTCLLLPIAPDGDRVTRVAKVLEVNSLSSAL